MLLYTSPPRRHRDRPLPSALLVLVLVLVLVGPTSRPADRPPSAAAAAAAYTHARQTYRPHRTCPTPDTGSYLSTAVKKRGRRLARRTWLPTTITSSTAPLSLRSRPSSMPCMRTRHYLTTTRAPS